MSSTETKTREKVEIAEPSMYNVIYMNDDRTTFEFVVMTLVNVFDTSISRAAEITQQVHEEGSAVVAVLPFEIAEQKGNEVMTMAKSEGFPLEVKLERETA